METPPNILQIIKPVYELLSYTNLNNFRMEEPLAEPYLSLSRIDGRNRELIQSPENTERLHRGSCYDQSFLVKRWMESIGVPTRHFHSVTMNLPRTNGVWHYAGGVVSHAFVLCLVNGVWKWIEWSWCANIRNDIREGDIAAALQKYKSTAESSWHHPVRLVEIKDHPSLPVPRLDFLNWCMAQDEIAL